MRLQRDPGMRPSCWLGNAKTVGHKLSGGCDWVKRQDLILANHRKRAARAQGRMADRELYEERMARLVTSASISEEEQKRYERSITRQTCRAAGRTIAERCMPGLGDRTLVDLLLADGKIPAAITSSTTYRSSHLRAHGDDQPSAIPSTEHRKAARAYRFTQ